MKSPAETLRDLGKLQEQKDQEYGADWRHFGDRMAAIFPLGVELKTPDDFGRFALLTLMAAKLGRYAANFHSGGHPDSLHDLAIYATMLDALDEDHGRTDHGQ